MKVLFLDIDGVFVTKKTIRRYKELGVTGTGRILDPVKVSLLDKIIRATDVKIVISSDWRIGKDLFTLQTIFAYAGSGFTHHFIGKTGTADSRKRSDEIADWLSKNAVSKAAILDDMGPGLDDFQRILFRTTWEDGLTDDIADQIISYFND